MRDQPVTKAEFEGSIAALTAAIAALTTQIYINNNRNDDNNKNNNRGGESIPVIRVHNNNHTVVMYKKSKHTRESDLEYYECRYYNKLKDDYYNFKISDSVYRCPFCYNKDYSLTELLRHASRMAGNLRHTTKDIAKHSVLMVYIQSYLNVKVDENKPKVELALSIEAYAPEINAVSFSIETLDEIEPSLLEKLNDPAGHSKPKEVEVVVEQETSVKIDESKDEQKEIDEQDDSEKDDVDEGKDESEKKQRVSFVKLPTESHEKPYAPSWSEKKLDGIIKETNNAKLKATLNSMNIFDTK